MDNLVYTIWLSLSVTPGTSTFSKLLDSFDSPEEIYSATDKQIRSAVGSNNSDATRLVNKDTTKASEIYEFCKSKGVGLLSYFDEDYPYQLKCISSPPPLLYYRGVLPDFNTGFRAAVVGTRTLSDYGRNNAFKLGYDLGSAGITVVSGMAIGIDGVALAGALASGASTIAVIGSGIDICYPMEHKRLAREIVKKGCVFTEYAPGTPPNKMNFPRRNRIVSGLSMTTLVVEGRERSGALITARHAIDQGRPVYAFPGNVGNANSEASNLLIKNGAKLFTGADDIVRDFEKDYPGLINPFNLKLRLPVNMMSVLSDLEVSALAPSDDVFRPSGSRRVSNKQNVKNEPLSQDTLSYENTKNNEEAPASTQFDADLLSLYKKIPPNQDIDIESLVDDDNSLRSVMKKLLKLEMGRFIIMLPGERVKRNIK